MCPTRRVRLNRVFGRNIADSARILPPAQRNRRGTVVAALRRAHPSRSALAVRPSRCDVNISKRRSATLLAAAVAVCAGALSGDARGQQQPPNVQIPQPGVPQITTLEGNFVRVAYNNEAYVILGYQMAQQSIGEPWMLIEVGMTVMDKVPDYTLKRDAISLETPTGTKVPLPTVEE